MFTVNYQPTKGEHRSVKLILKTIADIGLVGYVMPDLDIVSVARTYRSHVGHQMGHNIESLEAQATLNGSMLPP